MGSANVTAIDPFKGAPGACAAGIVCRMLGAGPLPPGAPVPPAAVDPAAPPLEAPAPPEGADEVLEDPPLHPTIPAAPTPTTTPTAIASAFLPTAMSVVPSPVPAAS
jgi:hypothetical protein